MKPTEETARKILDCVKIEERANFAAYMTEVYGDEGKIYTHVMIEDKKRLEEKIRLQDPDKILKVSAAVFKVDPQQVLSKSRKRNVTDARIMGMSASMNFGAFSTLMECGFFYNRNYTTVIHDLKVHDEMLQTNKFYQTSYMSFLNLIEQH